jgi:hypothetical protein
MYGSLLLEYIKVHQIEMIWWTFDNEQKLLKHGEFSWKFCGCKFESCEATFCPSTPNSMRWLYLEIYMLPMKEINASVFLNVKLRLWLKSSSLHPMHHWRFRFDKYIFQAQKIQIL